jgi:ribosomal protein L7/L12
MEEVDRAELVRLQLYNGRSLADIARFLIETGVSPIVAIKAMRSVTGARLSELKTLVDQARPPQQRAANERLRDVAEAAVRTIANEEID